jgi:cysteine desulfurase
MNSQPIYLDHQSTTKLFPEALEAMLPFLRDDYGNSSSQTHSYGWNAQSAQEKARSHVASLVDRESKEVYFTSGATESNNLSLLGLFNAYGDKKNHFISSEIEHSSVLEPLNWLSKKGAKVTLLKVDSQGHIDLDELRKAVTAQTLCISLMHSNNEIGTLNPIRQIGEIAKASEVRFHCDATQSLLWHSLEDSMDHIDLLSFSSHKIGGPKGVGGVAVKTQRPRLQIEPLMYGGGQEKDLRPGTSNVPAIVGFGAASEKAGRERDQIKQRLEVMRDQIGARITSELSFVKRNGDNKLCHPGNLSLTFRGIRAADIFRHLAKELAISSGSACLSGTGQPSHVLTAIGLSKEEALSTVRISLGWSTMPEEAEKAAEILVSVTKKLAV